jgi:hypothetical protein
LDEANERLVRARYLNPENPQVYKKIGQLNMRLEDYKAYESCVYAISFYLFLYFLLCIVHNVS